MNLHAMPAWVSVWLIVVLSMASIGCVSTARNTDGFKPPPGWVAANYSNKHPNFYHKSNDFSQAIWVTQNPHSPMPFSSGEVTRETSSVTPITICGDHHAILRTRSYVDPEFPPRKHGVAVLVQVESVDTTWNAVVTRAIYIRLYGTPADPEAEKSIRSICSGE